MEHIGSTELYSREDWRADPRPTSDRPMTGWDKTYLHHTVGSTPDSFDGECQEMRSIERIHKNNGWPTVGYTVIVARSGRAFRGFETTQNPWLSTRGVHTYNQNHISLAISLMGNYNNLHINAAQDRAIKDLYAYFQAQKGPVGMAGHRDVYATACPGQNAYDRIPHYNEVGPDPVEPIPPDKPDPEHIGGVVIAIVMKPCSEGGAAVHMMYDDGLLTRGESVNFFSNGTQVITPNKTTWNRMVHINRTARSARNETCAEGDELGLAAVTNC